MIIWPLLYLNWLQISIERFPRLWPQMPRHNKRAPVLVRGEPQRSGGLLSSLAIDSQGLATRTCPRIDPIEQAIAHSCARDERDWTLPTALWAHRVYKCAIWATSKSGKIRHGHVTNRQHRVKTGTYPTIYWTTDPNRWLDIGSVGGGASVAWVLTRHSLGQDDVSCWNSVYPPR